MSWSLTGIAIIQSGQPYSVIDFSGAVGSIYYSTFDGITNPIVPLAPGCTARARSPASSGAFYNNATGLGRGPQGTCFTLPLVSPGHDGVPPEITSKPLSPAANAISFASPGKSAPTLRW